MTRKFWFTATAAMAVAVCMAQPQDRPDRTQPDPKEIAQRRTDMMTDRLDLTEKQAKKVYKINLRQANKMTFATSGSRSSGDPQMSGGPGGGMRGGMGGPGGGMGGGMGGQRGGMGGPGGMGGQRGMHDGGQPQMERPQGGQAMAPPAYEESEKDAAKRDKQMHKILDGRQYDEWRKMEAERIREEFRPEIPLPGND